MLDSTHELHSYVSTYLSQFIRGGQGEPDAPAGDRERVAAHEGQPRGRQADGAHVARVGGGREGRGQPEDGDVVGQADGGHHAGDVGRVRPVVGEVDAVGAAGAAGAAHEPVVKVLYMVAIQ